MRNAENMRIRRSVALFSAFGAQIPHSINRCHLTAGIDFALFVGKDRKIFNRFIQTGRELNHADR